GLKADNSQSPYQRMRAISEKLLSSLEKEYGRKPPEGASLNERIDSLRTFILKTIASYLQLQISEKETQLDQVRIVRNALDDFIYSDEKEMSAYERKIHDEMAAQVKG